MATSNVEVEDSAWKGFYRIGGIAALIATVLFLSDIVVLIALGPLPSTANDWFTLLQNNRVIGIFQLFFTDLIGMVLLIPIIFALYAALRRANGVYSALAMALAFIGIAIIFATNTNYSLIYLSNQYAAATTEIQRAQLLTAGESTIAAGMWSTGPLVAGFLVESALVILSVVMLQDRTHVFGNGNRLSRNSGTWTRCGPFHCLLGLHTTLQLRPRSNDRYHPPGDWRHTSVDLVSPDCPQTPTAGASRKKDAIAASARISVDRMLC